MIKLQDFATQQGVTDRQVQRLLKKYASELEGLYERKGPNGTWLSPKACEILRSKMRQTPVVVGDNEIYQKYELLQEENRNLLKALNGAKDRIIELQEAQALLEASKKEVQLLEGFIQDAKSEINVLTNEKAVVSADRDEWKGKATQNEQNAQALSEELTDIKGKWWYKLFAGKKGRE